MPTVEFSRVNRRSLQLDLGIRPLVDDMQVLADEGSEYLQALVGRVNYLATDLTITADRRFLTGALGFSEDETLIQLDPAERSWIKAPQLEVFGATRQTVVPFAMDLAEARRWCGHVVTQRISSLRFRHAFEAVLNAAARQFGQILGSWEVDPVQDLRALTAWIAENPDVFKVARTVKLTNPLIDVDDVRRKMRLMRGNTWTDTVNAPRGEVLDTVSKAFQEHVEPIETGDAVVVLNARTGPGLGPRIYRSIAHRENAQIRNYRDLGDGVELVLEQTRVFSERRGDVVHDK